MTSARPRDPMHEVTDKSGMVTGQHGRWAGLFASHTIDGVILNQTH